MSPILDLQRRLREAGRIRIGHRVPTSNGGTRPAKLDTFRLTSADQHAVSAAAALYGGEVARWDDAPVGEQWEVVTTSTRLPVLVPPGDTSFSQWLEVWSGGGCTRRCDSRWEFIGDQPCVCDPQARDCTPHSRLSVILADLPGIGVWRLDTQGHYAAGELAGAVDVLKGAAARGQMLPAWLLLEQRQIKRPGQTTKKFAVPALELGTMVRELISQAPAAVADGETGELPARPALTAVPSGGPGPSVADQAKAIEAPKAAAARKNAATPIPPTGVKPRTAAQAGQGATVAAHHDLTQALQRLTSDQAKAFQSWRKAKRWNVPPENDEQAAQMLDKIGELTGDPFEAPVSDAVSRQRAFYAQVRDLGLEEVVGDADARHALILYATGGAVSSSTELVGWWEPVKAALESLAAGRLAVAYQLDGGVVVQEAVEVDAS